MKTAIDCYSCFIRQALQTARLAGADAEQQDHAVRAVMGYLLGSNPNESTVEVARAVQEIVRKFTGVSDPYKLVKEQSNWQAARWIRKADEHLRGDPARTFKKALRLAIAGNIIDYGPSGSHDLEGTLERSLQQPLAIDHSTLLMDRLEKARTLAYLADNAGEIAFDHLLLSVLQQRFDLESILFVVRERPFLNNAMDADADFFGIKSFPNVELLMMDAGRPAQASSACSVWERIEASDVRLAKGQANAEAYEEEDDFFLLFMVKCKLVAEAISAKGHGTVETGDMVLTHSSRVGQLAAT
jgi:uncharacterized protein with ATP-grasp and redox domains